MGGCRRNSVYGFKTKKYCINSNQPRDSETQRGKLNAFILDHFSKRECIKFVPDPRKTSGEICCCGRFLTDHNDAITGHNTVTWTSDACTKKSPTNAFGEIQFVGSANQCSRAPFVRLAEDTDVGSVMKLIQEQWKLVVPSLVISVTGGAKSFQLKPRLKEVFQRGLIKAARSSGAWIITGGTHTGVMKHVGEAVRHMKVFGGASSDLHVLGIATWGIVDRSADLISESGSGKYPASYHPVTPMEASKALLDSSHTHFILVDNGTVGQYGVEIDLRSKVEEAISRLQTRLKSETGSIEVPVVMLVLEGGPGAVKTMTEAIKKKIPAVVIDGSGRAADVVAFAFKHTIPGTKNRKTIHVIDPAYKDAVQAKVVEVFGEKKLEEVYSMIEDVLEDEKMITIYRLDEGGNTSRDIDLAILKALLKASRSSPLAQLNLALAWNRVDVAKSDIFTDTNNFKSEALHNPMMTALLDDKAGFFGLLLEEGLSMREFLNIKRIEKLYGSASGGLFKSLEKKHGKRSEIPKSIGYVLEELMGDSYRSYYLTNGHYDPQDPLPFPFLDLFTWAILSVKRALAILLWEKGSHPIATALFATKLLKEMARYSRETHHIPDTTEKLVKLADEFEGRALLVLDECFRNNERRARSLLVRRLEPFGDLTCMDIAWLACDHDFVAHPCCQMLFNKQWMGRIVTDTPWWKIFLCVLFPFLIHPLIYFHETDEYDWMEEEETCSLEDENMNKNDLMEMTECNDKEEQCRNHGIGDGDAVDVVLRQANYFERITMFYKAPFTKFVSSVCSYLIFLFMFCYVMLMDFQKKTISTMEYILMGWVGVLIVEEIRQISTQQPKHLLEKFSLYCADEWNFVDIISLVAFAVASILRFFPDDFDGFDVFEAARIIYILDIILFIVRSFQVFSVNRQLGPKLVMIKTMLEDLKQFIIILAVFIISYGVALQATLYPNTSTFLDVIRGIVEKPFFQMYGELFFEDFTDDNRGINGSGKWMGPALLGVYMLLTNVLLLSLLIAIFNYTFEKIQKRSDRVWKFQRYNLIREYRDRPTLPVPLTIFCHIFMFVKWVIQICGCGNKPEIGSALKRKPTDHKHEQLSSWENHGKEMELVNSKEKREEQMEERVKSINSKVDELVNQASSLEEQLSYTTQTLDKILGIVSSLSYTVGNAKRILGKKSVHVKARKSPYPQSTVMRVSLTDEMIAWEVPMPNYSPSIYTSDSVSRKPPWADVEIMFEHPRPLLKFNQVDLDCNVDRRSYTGKYKVVHGLPLNPMGRTGITGRGLLGRFGPNHAADPIVTRWKMTGSDALIENGKKVLEFVAIQRKDNKEWAIPGGMVEPGEQISQTLKKEFLEEALAGLDLPPEETEKLKAQVNCLFQEGREVFKGYVDDPRNTDVAWVETLAMNYHDDSGEIFNKIKLQAGDDAAAVRWQRVSGNIPLYANHVAMLENVARLHNANF